MSGDVQPRKRKDKRRKRGERWVELFLDLNPSPLFPSLQWASKQLFNHFPKNPSNFYNYQSFR